MAPSRSHFGFFVFFVTMATALIMFDFWAVGMFDQEDEYTPPGVKE